MSLWLAVIACLVAASSLTTANPSGSCASINYSTKCCPPGGNCNATDGPCHCGSECHRLEDCCTDVFCPENPTTCRDIGITECCNDESGSGKCDVHLNDRIKRRCSCNVSCHLRNDCCPDVMEIGCIPRTCSEAGKAPGCCKGKPKKHCYVAGGSCYCDSKCAIFKDCCDDVPVSCAASLLSSHFTVSKLNKKLKESRAQEMKENYYMHNRYVHH